MIDYHVHTMLCNHARGAMEQYIDHAVSSGLREICFLDHLTLNENGLGLSMTADEVPLYYYAARRLQAAYRGKIRIKVGLEIDFTPGLWDSAQKMAEQFDFDVIGGSVHFVKNNNLVSSKISSGKRGIPDDAFYESYLDLLDTMLDRTFIDVICHIDVIKKFGAIPPDWFYEKLRALLDKIAETDKTLEINTSGIHHPVGEIYPRPDLLKQCRKKNIPVSIGSDAHLPEQVGRNFTRAETILRQAGYSQIAGFDRKTRFLVPI
ncbi:MAG: histidinol-phosphatase [Desulfosalsimonas sp.]